MMLSGINEKLIYRHPHVFSTAKVKDAEEVLHNWQELKQKEKDKKGIRIHCCQRAENLPALSYSQEIQDRVAEVGFDWENDQGVMKNWRKKWPNLSRLKRV